MVQAVFDSLGGYRPQLEAQLLWIWTYTSYRNEHNEALDEMAFKHLYPAFQGSEPRDEALDVVAWAQRFHDQVLVPVPNPVSSPTHVTHLITSILAWADNMQQPQVAAEQLFPLYSTSPDIAVIHDLPPISPHPPGHFQIPEQQQSVFAGQFGYDTLEESDHSEQSQNPSCHYLEAALGTAQDAALQADTVSRNTLLDVYSAADVSNQFVPQRTPVRDDQPPVSVVDHTAALSQAMSLHNAVVGEMMHVRRGKGSCKFSRVYVHHPADATSPGQGSDVSPWVCACPTVPMWLQVL